jgi:cysteinyl-tRNA synthetase
MSLDLLGATFDIHGGGLDLQFPHHENEIAQSCCANPDGGFANVWMHNEMIQVDGKKMSKSLGNFFTVKDLLDQGVPGEVIRFVILSTHYRSPMDWTDKKVAEATATLRKWRKQVSGVTLDLSAERATDALAEDLNIAEIYMRMHSLSDQGKTVALKATGALLGLLEDGPMGDWAMERRITLEAVNVIANIRVVQPLEPVSDIAKYWENLREEKLYADSDQLKSNLAEIGINIRATKSGPEAEVTRPFDPAKLENLK